MKKALKKRAWKREREAERERERDTFDVENRRGPRIRMHPGSTERGARFDGIEQAYLSEGAAQAKQTHAVGDMIGWRLPVVVCVMTRPRGERNHF